VHNCLAIVSDNLLWGGLWSPAGYCSPTPGRAGAISIARIWLALFVENF